MSDNCINLDCWMARLAPRPEDISQVINYGVDYGESQTLVPTPTPVPVDWYQFGRFGEVYPPTENRPSVGIPTNSVNPYGASVRPHTRS